MNEDEAEVNITTKRWGRHEKVSLGKTEELQKCDQIAVYAGKSMFEIYSLFFSDEMLSHIVEQTNLYARRDKNMQTFKVDDVEMRKFIGLLIMSGYHHLPSENDYWSTADDMEAPIFAKTMSRDNFRRIKRFLHIADNNKLLPTKVAKVLPLIDKLRANCQQFGVFHQFLSIDESMVPYGGLHSAKQYIKGKPVKFGYKLWMLCSSDGFPYNFDIYCGKDGKRTTPLGSHVVNTMLSPVSNKAQHVVFFDNFFTSHTLLTNLAAEGIRACGTVRENEQAVVPS